MIPTLYEPFKHWSEGGSVYILSDLHFGDTDCKLMDPGWITPEEQLAIINGMVMKNDTFVCLGDVGKAEYLKSKSRTTSRAGGTDLGGNSISVKMLNLDCDFPEIRKQLDDIVYFGFDMEVWR